MTHGQLGPVSGAQPGKIGDIAQATLHSSKPLAKAIHVLQGREIAG
jgi:hypothetical protein